MRPVSSEKDPVLQPLNYILGTESAVRILRGFSASGRSMGAPEMATVAGLTPAGTRLALARLVETGVVQRTGTGRQVLYSLRLDSIGMALRRLFDGESERYSDLVGAVKLAALGAEPVPERVWIRSGESISELQVWVRTTPAGLGEVRSSLQAALVPVEIKMDLTIEVIPISKADPAPPADAQLILSEPVSRNRGKALSHQEQEDRSRIWAQRVAELLESSPDIVKRATQFVQRQLEVGHGAADNDLREWLSILTTYSSHRLKTFLVSQSPRGQRLRQSSPFPPVLTENERRLVITSAI